MWLSVDPLAEKYPNVSPYAYTFQNPVRFIDPTGMMPDGGPTRSSKGTDDYYYDSETGTQYQGKENGNWSYREPNGDLGIYGDPERAGRHILDDSNTSETSTPIMNTTSSGGSVISTIGGELEKMAKNREFYFNTEKTIIQRGRIRQLNVKTYRAWKTAGRIANGIGIAITINDALNDVNEGKYYAAGARLIVSGGITVVSSFCPVCGLGLSIGEAYFGQYIYDAVQDFGDTHIYQTPKQNPRMGDGTIFSGSTRLEF